MLRKSYFLIFTIIFLSFGLSGCLPFSLLESGRTAKKTNKKGLPKSKSENREKTDSEPKILKVEKTVNYVNAMGNEMPEIPEFDELSPEPGKVRGYVKDINGNPLEGAYIGVRSTAIGGAYSGANAETDAEGYYEVQIPYGVAHFYAAGYTVDWGEGRAGMSLHSVDGKSKGFASNVGAVRNFVLLPYGITSRDDLSENPHLASTYYGGSIYIGFWTREASDEYASPKNIVENSVIEVTLTPEGDMMDENAEKTFVVRKVAGYGGGFKINNIPVGRYQISAKLSDGKPLKMSLNKPRNTVFGMTPTETTKTASVLFQPGDAKASMVIPNYGNWNSVEISVEIP
jgi:hypothetical protein